jgi:hypothetical protein
MVNVFFSNNTFNSDVEIDFISDCELQLIKRNSSVKAKNSFHFIYFKVDGQTAAVLSIVVFFNSCITTATLIML